MHAPIEDHFRALKRILRYVKGTVHHGLQLHCTSSHELLAYFDADWVGFLDTRRSTSDYLIFFGINLVSWCSKKQSTFSRSSTEAEYRSLAITTAEVAWIVQLLHDLRLPLPSPLKILCDNRNALFMAVNPVTRSRSKHIAINYYFVRELIANGSLKVAFTPSHLPLADSFTRASPSPSSYFFVTSFMLFLLPHSTCKGVIRQNPLLIYSFFDLRLFVIMYIYLFLVCRIFQLYIHSI